MVIRSPQFSSLSSRVGADTSASRNNAIQRLNALTGKSGYYFQAYTATSGDLTRFQALGAPSLAFGGNVSAAGKAGSSPAAVGNPATTAASPTGFRSAIGHHLKKNSLPLMFGSAAAITGGVTGTFPPVTGAAIGALIAWVADQFAKTAALSGTARQAARDQLTQTMSTVGNTIRRGWENIPASFSRMVSMKLRVPALQFGAKAGARHHGTPVSAVNSATDIANSAATIAAQRLTRLSAEDRVNPFAGYHAVVRFSGVSAPNAVSSTAPAAGGFHAQSARLASTANTAATRSHALPAARRSLKLSGLHNLFSPVGMLVLSADSAGVSRASVLTARRNGAVAQSSITINV